MQKRNPNKLQQSVLDAYIGTRYQSIMLPQDPKKRATADQILGHSWMRENGTASDKPLDNVILTRMRGFLNMNKLKKEALKVIAGGMSPEEIAGLRSMFQVGAAVVQTRWFPCSQNSHPLGSLIP